MPGEGGEAPGGAVAAADAGGAQEQQGNNMMRTGMQMMLVWMVINGFMQPMKQQLAPVGQNASAVAGDPQALARPVQFRNMYGPAEECDLFVYYSLHDKAPSAPAIGNQTLAQEAGYRLLWNPRVWYAADAAEVSVNVAVGPLPPEVLSGDALAYIHAALVRRSALEGEGPGAAEAITQSLPLVAKLRVLAADAGTTSLFGSGDEVGMPVQQNFSAAEKVPYFKTKLGIRPVFDHTVHQGASIEQGPFKRIKLHADLGVYEPYLYISDFWLLEKDYQPLNASLEGAELDLNLTYSTASLWVWSMQAQMAEQWTTQNEWSMSDPQRDSFMLKRLLIDTNPYLLAFSAAFIMLHLLFSLLAFKNEIQFWRENESMQGLSARSMCISFVCQVITALYLLDSQETSRVILIQIIADLAIATWKLKKAIKIEVTMQYPFLHFAGQKGYDEAGTSKYDEEALRYMGFLLTPLFIMYVIRSALYEKHRGWYSFLVSSAAGGVYTFGFAMMTPQLYINYKLQSVEHMPWRALTYKAMNTFVDDVFALLIDMPLMHRLSCFRDDVIFFIFLFQRWKYRVDKTRPSIWASPPVEGALPAPPIGSSTAPEPVEGALPTPPIASPIEPEPVEGALPTPPIVPSIEPEPKPTPSSPRTSAQHKKTQ